MSRNVLRKYSLVVQFLLILVGVVFILLSTIESIAPQGSKKGLALFSLGLTFITTTILSQLHSILGTDVPTMIEQRLNFQRNVYDLGLEGIYLGVGDETIFDRFQNARSIDLMYNTAKNCTYRYGSRIEEAIAKRGCRVRILIADPDNTAFKDKNIIDGLCPGTDIPSEIRDVVSHLSFMVDNLKRQVPSLEAGSLELRRYSCLPANSLVIVDGEVVRHTPYLPYFHSADVPIFEITKERGGRLFLQYSNLFERVWDKSTTVLREEFLPRKARRMRGPLTLMDRQ